MRKLNAPVLVGAMALWLLSPPASGAPAEVRINASGCPGGAAFCFVPPSATATTVDAVTWRNTTNSPHTVTRCSANTCPVDGGNGSDPFSDSGNIAANGTFVHTFSGAGTYNYFCTVHGYNVMHGTVTVAAASGGVTPAGGGGTTTGGGGTTSSTRATSTSSTSSTTRSSTTSSSTTSTTPSTTTTRTPTTPARTGPIESLLLAGIGLVLVAMGATVRLSPSWRTEPRGRPWPR